MKLESKHIAPYLPYGLKGTYTRPNGKDVIILDGFVCDKGIRLFKPILHPLSDLTKEIEVNGEKFVPIDKLYDDLNLRLAGLSKYGIERVITERVELVDFWAVNYIISWHFDVFGLIKNNLAIDINTIK